MLTNIQNTYARAENLARERGCRMAVVEMDHDDSRRICIVREDYTHGDEFKAFCGEVIGVVGSDGAWDDIGQ